MPHVDEGTLHAYLDGELPSTERTAVDAHLAQCATCRATLTEARALLERASALLGAARPVERPAPPLEQLRRSPKRSPWRVRTSFAWAASVALALGLGYYLRSPADSNGILTPSQAVAVTEDRAAPAVPAPANNASRAEPRAGVRRELERARQPASRTDEVAERDARAETPAAAAGATAQLKAAPTALDTSTRKAPLALEEVVVTAAAAPPAGDQAERRGRAVAAEWQTITRGTARALLGTEPVGLPGLATRRIRRSPAPDSTVVVEQALDASTVIEVFQRPAGTIGYYVDGAKLDTPARALGREHAPAAVAARQMAPADRLARFVGRLRVEIAGPLSLDSLNRLLEQVQPLP